MQEISYLRLSFAAVVVLLIPGGALLAWLSSASRRSSGPRACWDPIADLADAAALSISVSAVLALFAFLLGLRMGAAGLAGLYLFCLAAAVAAGLWRRQRLPGGPGWLDTAGMALLAILFFAGLAAWRLYQARELALPAWVDPVHHAMAVRVILERGGVPSDLGPLIPAAFAYHYGFHLSAALFAFWSGAPPEQAVLWFGQVLNGAVALSVYRLGTALLNAAEREGMPFAPRPRLRGWTPLLAALLVGFVFQMPAYYLTWGRFTLLAGLVILGPVTAAALEAWDDPSRVAPWIRLAVLICGLALTHIFALLLAGLFLMILWGAAFMRYFQHDEHQDFLWRMIAAGTAGLLFAAPWLWWAQSQSGMLARVTVNPIIQSDEAIRKQAQDYLRYLSFLIGPLRGHILLGMAGMGLLFALREPRRRFLVIWAVLLGVFSLPWGLAFDPFRPDYFAIILFFPASLLLAFLLADACAALAAVSSRRWPGWLALGLVTGLFLTWGVRETSYIINPVTVIATPADARALEWVRGNTSPDARFYINSALWLEEIYRGVDGGYWLEPAAGRVSLVPPMFYVFGAPDYTAAIKRWADQATRVNGCTPEFWQVVEEARLTHVYLREGQGSLQPAALVGCPRLQAVYEAEGVHIYEISPSPLLGHP